MTTFTGPVHIRASADAPTGQNVYQAAIPLGTLSLVSGGGTSGVIFTGAGNPIIFTSASTGETTVRFRGLVKIIVDGTVALVPFFYSST